MSIPRFWREIRQRYKGIGTECGVCNRVYFPPREVCPDCGRDSLGDMKEREISGKGKVLTFTEVHEPMPDFEILSPYIMAIVEMDEGVRMTGQLVGVEFEEVKNGMEVEAVLRKLGEESPSGIIYYGYKFRPCR